MSRRRRRGGLTLGALTPLSVEGLVAWYDGELSPITSSGGSVSQWNDISGNENHAFQSLGSSQPTTSATTLNGKNVIDFDGSEVLEMPSALYSIPDGPNTIFVVVKTNTTGTLSSIEAPISFTESTFFRRGVQYTTTDNQVRSSNSVTGSGSPFANQENVLVNEFNIFTTRYEGPAGSGSSTLYQDFSYNSNTVVQSVNGSNEDGIDEATIGAQNTGLAQPLDGSIAVILIYDRFLSLDEKRKVENYLSARWGIANDPIGRYRPLVWVDPSVAGAVTAGDADDSVSLLQDLSGNGNHLTQTTASLQPLTGQETVNGKNVISIDFVNDTYGYVSKQVSGVSSDNTSFWVLRSDDHDDNNAGMASLFNPNSQYFLQNFNTSPNPRFNLNTNAGNNINPGIGGLEGNLIQVTIRMRFSQTDYTYELVSDNGNNFAQTETYTSGEISGETGFRYGLANVAANTGILGAALLYNYALTDDQMDEVQSQLLSDWRGIPIGYNPVLWLDAADSSTITESGGSVSTWADKSGNANDATQGSASKQPTIGVPTVNGLNVIKFNDADSQTLSVADDGIFDVFGGSYTIFTVLYTDNPGVNQRPFYITSGSGDVNLGNIDSGNVAERVTFGVNGISAQNSSVDNTLPYIAAFVRDGTTITNTFNSDTESTATDASVIDITPTRVDIGSDSDSGAYLSGNIAEILVFDFAMSDIERSVIEDYLDSKWGNTPDAPNGYNPVLWLDASDRSTITESDGNISTWADKSGNGNDVTQGSASLQPTLGTSTQNGLNVIDFDGGNSLTLPSDLHSIPDGNNTFFAIAKRDTETGSTENIVNMQESGSVRYATIFDSTANQLGAINSNVSDFILLSGTSNTDYQIINFIRDGVQRTLTANGSISTTDNDGVSEDGVDSAAIGSNAAVSGAFLTGSIAEVILFDYALSDTQISLMNQYLSNKWGINLS